MIEEVVFDRDKSTIAAEFVVLAVAPDADDLPAIADVVGNVFKVAAADGVVTAAFTGVADERAAVVLPLEKSSGRGDCGCR